MRAISIIFIIISVCSCVDLMEWKLSGGIMENGFSTVINVGTRTSGAPLMSFKMYLDLETSATLIPSIHCENCKPGSGYDREKSESESIVACFEDYCDKNNAKLCPNNHSKKGQCCSNYEKEMCGWNSKVGSFGSSYYAEGSIVSDEFVFSSNRFKAYFVEVFNSTFEDLPSTAVGILGLGEKSCNPTCIDPIYNSIQQSISWASNAFTMCFGLREGILSMGIIDKKFQNGPAFYTYQRPNEYGYTYDITDLRVANHSVFNSHDKLIGVIKSNDKYIRLPRAIYNKWREYIMNNYSVKNGTVFEETMMTDIEKFPTFDIQFNGVLLHLPPQQYFLRSQPTVRYYTIGIIPTNEDHAWLGLTFMRGFVTIFDQEKTGFASANKFQCYAQDDTEGVGTVEWAPTVKPESFGPAWLIVCVIIMGVLVVICITALIIIKYKQKKVVQQFGYTNLEPLQVQTV